MADGRAGLLRDDVLGTFFQAEAIATHGDSTGGDDNDVVAFTSEITHHFSEDTENGELNATIGTRDRRGTNLQNHNLLFLRLLLVMQVRLERVREVVDLEEKHNPNDMVI